MLVALAAITVSAWGQTPVVSRVVNSASYQPTFGSPGSIASIFGANLAATTAAAQAVPLPFELGGTSVTVLGQAVPLYYVSPVQINFQVPNAGVVDLVVSTAAGTSQPYGPPDNAWNEAGVFTMDESGCGQGAVLNMAADGSLSVNSSGNSASPGDWISVYATGVTGIYTDGFAAPLAPLLGEAPGASVEFDLQGVNQAVSAGWTGLTPGFVGLDQVNVQVPATVREGCAVPIQVWYGVSYGGLLQVLSQPVTIAIMQGGGPCADPPSAGYGQITWQKIVNTTELSAVTETDMVTAALQASPGMLAPPAPVYIDGCPPPTGICDVGPGIPTSMTLLGPACPVAGYRSLAAGTVTMQGPNLGPAPVPLVPQQGPVSGLSVYQATLPAGALQTGSYTLTANGGADVGAFQATIQIGADIRIQTPLGELDVFSDCKPLTISWTGGDPKSWVTARLVFQHADGSQSTEVPVRTRTANGTLTDPGSARVRLLDGSFGTY